MESLSYYRIGKTTLPRGVPLRVAVGMESDGGPPLRSRRGRAPRPNLLLVPSETATEEEPHAARTFGFEPSRVSEDGRFLFEVATEEFAPGPFELLILFGDEERVQFGEDVWILEREDYEDLLRELGDEEFLPSPSLHGGPAAADYVEGLIRERLLEDSFGVDDSRFRFRRSIPEGIADEPFPSSPIRWTTEQVVDAFREVALFGVKDAFWTLELTGDRYGLRCDGELLDPLSDATAEALLGEDGERFLSLAFEDFREMDVLWEIRRGSRRFSLGASHGIEGFPIEVGARVGLDEEAQDNVNRAAQEWTEAVRQSFQALADRTTTLQESNLRLTQNFFQQFVEQLQSQTQGNRQVTQTLRQQGQRQQRAFETLAQESANAYADFLNSALSFYQQTLQQATQVAQSNLHTAGQVAQSGVQAASQAAQGSASAAGQAAGQSANAAGGRTSR